MRNALGRTARILGKSFKSGFSQPGEVNFVSRLSKKGNVGRGLKFAGHAARYAGQATQGLTHPGMVASMGISYLPMMMMNNSYDAVPMENSNPNLPQPGSQQTYAQTNLMDPIPEIELARLTQMQQQQERYGM